MSTDSKVVQALPCPFCGHVGLDFNDGSTYRLGLASCAGCGATCKEVRRDYPDSGRWYADAIAAWNTRASLDSKPAIEQAESTNAAVPLSAIRPIAVEAIRAVTGCPDLKGNGLYLVDELESVAKAAAKTLAAEQAAEQAEQEELDTYDCDACAGAGWNWEHRQVAERKSDMQEFKIPCAACDGRGYVGGERAHGIGEE